MDAIKISNLTKVFEKFTAVDHIHMTVPKGVVYGFIGPNGAGKTTTIGMIMGHKKVSEGTIEVLGESINFHDSSYKKHLGFVSDVPEFYNWMTAREYLTFTGEIFGLTKKDLKVRINELLDLVDLQDTRKAVGSYSRGMKQRLGIAQALIHDPEILIMDEPTSALDPIGRKEVMDIVLKLKGNKTIFYSTHILTDVERVCDMVAIINKGKVLIEDSIEHIKKRFFETKIIIETNQSFETLKSEFLKEKWCKDVFISGVDTCLTVTDEDLAMVEIPKIVSKNNWMLRKFIKEEHSLEDIFLKVVDNV